MAVETLKIVPELDPAAAKKFQSQMDKLTDPVGRAMRQATGSVSSFQAQVKQVENTLIASRKSAADYKRDLSKAERATEKMRIDLYRAERALGKSSPEVQRMRRQYDLARKAAEVLKEETDKRLAAEKRVTDEKKAQARASRDAEKATKAAARDAEKEAKAAKKTRSERIGKGLGFVKGAGLAAAGAAVAGVAGAAAGLQDVRANADRAAKSANLTVEEFGRLGHAAELSGTDIETVEKATQKLAQNLSKKPSAEFAGGLKALGLTAKDLQGLDTEGRLRKIADAMKDVEDPTQRTAIASRLLGEEMGAKLVPMLENGGDAIASAGDEAERLGLVFDADTAAAAERLGDAQDRLAKVAGGAMNQAFTALVPLAADFAEGLFAQATASGGLADQLRGAIEGLLEFGASTWEAIGPAVMDLLPQLGDLFGAVFDTIVDMWPAAMSGINSLLDALTPVLEILEAIVPIVGVVLKQAFEALGTVLDTIGTLLGGIVDSFRIFASGDILGGLKTLGGAIIDALLVPLRYLVGEVVDLADAVGGSNLVPQSVRAFSGRTALGGILGKIQGIPGPGAPAPAPPPPPGAPAPAPTPPGKPGKPGKGQRDRINRDLAGGGGGGKGKKDRSAAGAAVEADIKKYAEAAGTAAYQQAIASGASLKEAEKAAKAAQKAKTKELQDRPDLVRAGLLGQGTSALTGVPLTAGGALPIALDLGSKGGGPPPVQIIQVAQGAEINLEFPQARFDADLSTLSDTVAPAVRSEMERMWASVIPAISGGVQTR